MPYAKMENNPVKKVVYNEVMKENRDRVRIVFALAVALCCIPFFLLLNKEITFFDEGYMLEGARKIIVGELPYRDFHFLYTPGTVLFLAIILKISLFFGGAPVITERITITMLSMIRVVFLGKVVLKLTKNSILAFLAMTYYSVWEPTHINLFWPVMCVIPLSYVYFFVS